MLFKQYYKKCNHLSFILIKTVVTVTIFNFAFLQNCSYASSFNVPEKLIYDLKWLGLKVGKASLEITREEDKIKITSSASSTKWVSIVYPVNDRIDSILVKKTHSSYIGQPVHHRIKIREGTHRLDREIIFNHATNKTTFIDHLKNEKKEFDVPAFVFDPISSFYYLRTLVLEEGKTTNLPVFYGNNFQNVEVQVLRKEKVTLPIGTFDTIVVKPLFTSEGIFYQKSDMLIWLTNDMKHIPIMMKTKVIIHYVTAILVEGAY